MRVFISWSGERSKTIAEALRYWLPKVIQAVQPWMSANDIEKGTRWRSGIANELEQSSVGIICLTPENLGSTWIHFEAGALSKQQQNTYVCTFLYELEPADVREPLAQFQTTKAQKEDIRKLVETINNARDDGRLPESEINESFDVWWPKLEQRLSSIPAPKETPEPQRNDRDILEEILQIVRAQSRINKEYKAIRKPLSPQQISGKELSLGDVTRLAAHLGIPISETRLLDFERSKLIKLLRLIKEREENHPVEVKGDWVEVDMSAPEEEGSDENTNS
ncbi:MAG: toll/interleukin-1 receptor domain-containing protein [Pyrinomonadaceae bacterium]